MSQENSTQTSADRKNTLKKDLRDGIAGLKDLLIAAIALAVNISKSISKKQKINALEKIKSNNPNHSKSSLSIIRGTNQGSEAEPVDISIELENGKYKFINEKFISNVVYPLLATLSTTSLVVGAFRLAPLAKWTKTQNLCIESISKNKVENISLVSKVMTCNGGHSY